MLNSEHFQLLAGNPREWDEETLHRIHEMKEPLTDIQEDQHERGRRSAELLHGVHGWYVRYASGLDDFGVLAREGVELDGSLLSAVFWGVSWTKQDPVNREFFVCKLLLEGQESPILLPQ